ncbi:MAG: hypothetical protein VX948_00440 [Candidatus Latescibacterota bacterium]|nr:hypothetical protein [Candidatus Latescibacterota bacterium]
MSETPTSYGLNKAERAVLKELRRCDVPNRRNGKTRFRYGHRKLANDSGYGRTATSEAIKGLRQKIELKAERTGLSLLFEVPACADEALKEHRTSPASEVQPANVRSPESEPRNKDALKKQLQSVQLSRVEESERERPRTGIARSDADSAMDLVLDFMMETNCSWRVDTEAFVSKHGLDRLCAELSRLQNHRSVSIGVGSAGSLQVIPPVTQEAEAPQEQRR